MMRTDVPASGSLSWRSWIALALLWAASAYLWIWPLWRPRGIWLWEHYRFLDIYLGLPVALVTVCVTLVALMPARLRRPLALRLTAMCMTLIVSALAGDLIYSLVVMDAWRPNFWLDQAHITRRYSIGDPELGFVRKARIRWRRRTPGRTPDAERIVDYRTDEHGFRNPPGVSRADIVFIGDSYTEAGQVEEQETFVQRVAEGTGMTAVNLGRGAYGPQQELIVLERYGLRYQPRVVVWQMFEGNDLNDARTFAKWRRNPQPPTSPLHGRYFENSLLRLLLDGTAWKRSDAHQATLRYHDGLAQQVRIRYPDTPRQTEEKTLGFAETKNAIEAGYRLCQSRGIQLVIIYVPVMVRVMEPWLDFASAADRERYLTGDSLGTLLDFGNQLAAFCRQLGCPYLDLFPALRSRAVTDNRKLYIPIDEHLDIQGHEAVAEAVIEVLADINRNQSVMKVPSKD
jgi:GDSL-like Lipase/Acylhydrolase family